MIEKYWKWLIVIQGPEFSHVCSEIKVLGFAGSGWYMVISFTCIFWETLVPTWWLRGQGLLVCTGTDHATFSKNLHSNQPGRLFQRSSACGQCQSRQKQSPWCGRTPSQIARFNSSNFWLSHCSNFWTNSENPPTAALVSAALVCCQALSTSWRIWSCHVFLS